MLPPPNGGGLGKGQVVAEKLRSQTTEGKRLMTSQTVPPRGTVATAAAQASWLPMIIIALAQIQLSFNIGALQVSIGGIVEDFKTAPTSVSTALVVYSLAVASFVMLGAKLDKIIGSRTMFQAGVVVHGIAMGMMALSTTASRMIQVQGLARLVAALMVPSLVVLIATHYVLVSASPKALAGDVGALRGTANNLSTALGTAIVGALAVGVLGALIAGMATAHPDIPPALLRQVNLDNVEFVSNDQLDEILAATTATPEQVAAAIVINEEARLRALKASFLMLAGIAALAIIPASGLPGYKPEEISVEASDEAVTGSGKSRLHPARARCGAPDAGHQRPVERLERTRAEDDHPGEGGRQLSSRLVANQNPHKIYELLKARIEALAPPTVRVEVRLLTTGEPALIPFDLPAMQAAARAYERGWGATPTFVRGGGSIPIVADIARLMQIPVVMMGYGLDDDGLHAPNESYSLEMFRRGIETAIVYLEELAHLERQG